jgi:hypothetical protein
MTLKDTTLQTAAPTTLTPMNDEHQYYWWTNKAREDMAGLITQMGLGNCPVCDGPAQSVLPWPALIGIGGLGSKPQDEPPQGNILFMALVRCERCGHTMTSDSEKLTGKTEPPLWSGPSSPTDY